MKTWGEVLFYVLVFTLVLTLGFQIVSAVEGISCRSRWDGSGMQTQYTLMGGCRVQMSDGRWLPEDRVRDISLAPASKKE